MIDRVLGMRTAAQPDDAVLISVDVDASDARDVVRGQFGLDLGRDDRILHEGFRMRAIDVRVLRQGNRPGQYSGQQQTCNYTFYYHDFVSVSVVITLATFLPGWSLRCNRTAPTAAWGICTAAVGVVLLAERSLTGATPPPHPAGYNSWSMGKRASVCISQRCHA